VIEIASMDFDTPPGIRYRGACSDKRSQFSPEIHKRRDQVATDESRAAGNHHLTAGIGVAAQPVLF
jgi:hypothetical protein